MVPSEDEMVSIVAAVEAAHDKEGWDQPAVLYMVVASNNRSKLVTSPHTFQPRELGADLGEAMVIMAEVAENFVAGEVKRMDPITQDAFAGLVLLHEGWSISPQQRERYPRRESKNVPGALELRQAVSIDCAGRMVTVTRIKGASPETLIARPNSREKAYAGRIPEAMVRILKAYTRHAPGDSVDRQALNHILREIRARNER